VRKIKILFVIDNIFHIGGGTEGQLSKLVNHLNRDRFEVGLAVLRNSAWVETDHFDCRRLVLGIGSLKHPNTWKKVRKLSHFIRDEKTDIVETFFTDSNLLGTIAGHWGKARKIIFAQRSLTYNLDWSHSLALRQVGRWVDRYLVNCQAIRKDLAVNLGVSQDRIDLIYNGIQYQRFGRKHNDPKRKLREELGIQDGDLVVGIVANFRPVKNIDSFLRAAAQVSDQFPGAKFLIVGGGKPEETKRLKRLSHELNIGEKVLWTGMIENVIPYLGLLNVGALSSLSEGLSNTVLEYMANGLPAVVTAVGGNTELIIDGQNGFLVPVNDHIALAKKIALLLDNHQLREEIGKANQKTVQEKFSLKRMIDNHEEYFRRLLEHGDN